MIKAVGDKIVVEVLKREKTKSGLVIPDAAVIDPQGYGRVVSISEELVKAGSNIKEGDILVFHLRAGMDIILDYKVFKTLKYDEVYGVLEDKDIESQLQQLSLKNQEKKIIGV